MNETLLLLHLLLNSAVPPAHALPHDLLPPPQSMQRICSQCHALEVMGKCLAGDCASDQVRRIATPQPWDLVLDRMQGRGAKFTSDEQQEILAYLQQSFPPKQYPLAWEKVGDFAGKGGWNIVSLREYAGFLYAGFEGNGKIFRTSDGITWGEVASTGNDSVYGITPFKGVLYAGSAEPDPQIWRSRDGQHWQQYANLPRADGGIHSMGVFKNKLYAGTGRSWIYRSSDGKKWAKITTLKKDVLPVFQNWTRFLIPFKGYLYAGTEIGSLYRSSDGLNWTQTNLEISSYNGLRGATVFNNALYVGTTGDKGTIWKTQDGQSWQRVFQSADNSATYVASLAVAGKYLFASISGYVFRSLDGLAWEEVGHLSPYTLEAMISWRGQIYAGALTAPAGSIFRANPAQKLVLPRSTSPSKPINRTTHSLSTIR